ncbi:hypothetical protein ACSBR2_012129 [Camellia fascicularis]
MAKTKSQKTSSRFQTENLQSDSKPDLVENTHNILTLTPRTPILWRKVEVLTLPRQANQQKNCIFGGAKLTHTPGGTATPCPEAVTHHFLTDETVNCPDPSTAQEQESSNPTLRVGEATSRPHSLCSSSTSQANNCAACVAEASGEIRKRCSYNKGSVIWYDNCLVKYSNTDFFGKIDNGNRFYMWNLRNVSNPLSFNQKTKDLLSQLSQQAYVTPKMYAAGESELGYSEKLYGLVQCTRDLSSVDC